MSDIVIKDENLGKKYIIGHQAERGNYTALRDVLMQNARTLWNKTKDLELGNQSYRARRWKKCKGLVRSPIQLPYCFQIVMVQC